MFGDFIKLHQWIFTLCNCVFEHLNVEYWYTILPHVASCRGLMFLTCLSVSPVYRCMGFIETACNNDTVCLFVFYRKFRIFSGRGDVWSKLNTLLNSVAAQLLFNCCTEFNIVGNKNTKSICAYYKKNRIKVCFQDLCLLWTKKFQIWNNAIW